MEVTGRGQLSGEPGPAVGRRRAAGRRHRLDRAMAGYRALVGHRARLQEGQVPAGYRRRRRLARCRAGWPLADRGQLRLTAYLVTARVAGAQRGTVSAGAQRGMVSPGRKTQQPGEFASPALPHLSAMLKLRLLEGQQAWRRACGRV